jgi:hypothetical protein
VLHFILTSFLFRVKTSGDHLNNRALPDHRDSQRLRPVTTSGKTAAQGGRKAAKEKKTKIKVPKRAAVVLTAVDKEKVSVADALAKIRSKIDLRAMGIASLRPRRALTGAIIYEVPGEESQAKADELVVKFRSELDAGEFKVARPTKTAELRLFGLDDVTDDRGVAEAHGHGWGLRGLEGPGRDYQAAAEWAWDPFGSNVPRLQLASSLRRVECRWAG